MLSSVKQVEYRNRHMHSDLAARYHRLLGDPKRILDLGCGFGGLGCWKPSNEVNIYGLDNNLLTLHEAKKWEFVVMCELDDESLPYHSEVFDAVLAKDILEHLWRPWKILKEIRRVLVPGGNVLVSTSLPKPSAVWNDYTHVRGFTKKALQQMFEDNGFEVIRVIRMGGLRGFGRLRLISLLPVVMNLPIIGRILAVNHELLAKKIS